MSDQDVKRPVVGQRFWLQGKRSSKWSVCDATEDGLSIGELFYSWEKFDYKVSAGFWKWRQKEPTHE